MRAIGVLLWGGMAALATLLGCAQVGPPLPPSAHLPRPPADFQAVRQGPEVVLRWTQPRLTSDGVALKGAVSYRLCAWATDVVPPPPAGAPARTAAAGSAAGGRAVKPPTPVTQPQVPSPPLAHFASALDPAGARLPPCPQLRAIKVTLEPEQGQQQRAQAVIQLDRWFAASEAGLGSLALYATNQAGAGAGWSNPAEVALTAVAAAPRLSFTVIEAGVRLDWSPALPPGQRVLVYRQPTAASKPAAPRPESGGQSAFPRALGGGTAATSAQLIATVSAGGAYLDSGVDWNREYSYWLRAAAGSGAAAVESQDSNHVTVATRDLFPPPVPNGLEATLAPGGGAVDLSWNAVAARDLAGYSLYRQLPGQSGWEKRNPVLLLTPVFHDTLPSALAAGAEVRYAVTASDESGNESARSAGVGIAAPGGEF